MDRLEQIMKKQNELQQRLGVNFSRMTLEDRAAFMRDHRGYLADEVAEALYEMPCYKLWKDYSKMSEEEVAIAWQKVRMELIDSLHFFVNLLLCAGMTASEVYEMYMAKNKENHRRQDAGYTADVSYREQGVDEVMNNEPMCTIAMDGELHGSSDFVALTYSPNGEATLHYNTDAVSLGIAIKMIAQKYEEILSSYPIETQEEIREVLANG